MFPVVSVDGLFYKGALSPSAGRYEYDILPVPEGRLKFFNLLDAIAKHAIFYGLAKLKGVFHNKYLIECYTNIVKIYYLFLYCTGLGNISIGKNLRSITLSSSERNLKFSGVRGCQRNS